MAKLFYNIANNAKTTITNNPLSSGGTSITLSAGTGTKFPSEYFVATIWDDTTYPSNPGGDPNMEIVYCDSRSTDTVTVNASGRGFGGTTGVAHNSGSAFAILDTKQFEDQMTTALTTGWVPVADTWTFASVDNPTGVVTVPTNGTTTYSVGMRIKFTNAGNTVYGIVTAVAATSLTFLHEISPTSSSASGGTAALNIMQNSAITAVYFSHWKNPYGFPADPRKWTVELVDITNRQQASPTQATWYNLGSLSLSVPIGSWDLSYAANGWIQKNTATAVEMYVTLSTANNSESDTTLSRLLYWEGASATVSIIHSLTARKFVTLASKTPYYLNAYTASASVGSINFYKGTPGTSAIVRATCAYL